MWGCGVYTDCRGWFGFVQDLWGKYLKDSVIFGWLALLMVFLLVVYGCVVLYGPEVCSDTKIDAGKPEQN